MPVIRIPNVGDIRFPDTMSNADIEDAIKNKILPQYEKQAKPTEDTGLLDMTGRAFMRGAKQLGSTLGDVLPAMAASAVGADEYAKRQMEEAAATQKEIKEKYAPRYESYRDVKGLGDVLPFILESGVEQIPNIASVLVPGGAAGAVGRGIAGRLGAEAIAARAAEKGLEGEAAAKFAERTAGVVAGRQALGTKAGQAIGTYLGSYALNAPEVFQNIYEETGGKLEPAAAALAGTVSAALDSFLPAHILNKFTPGMKAGVVERILEKSGMKPGLARGAVARALESAGIEAPTEAAQEAISIAAEKFVNDHADAWNSKDFQRIVDAGVAGAAGSVLFGGLAGGAGGYRQKKLAQQAEKPSAPEGRNAYDEADQHTLDLEAEAERAAIRGESTAPATTPPSAEDQFAEEAFPSMETLQARYNELEKERKALLKQEQTEETQARLAEIDTQQEQIAGEQDQLENRLQEQRAVRPPPIPQPGISAASSTEQAGLDLGEPVAPEERTAPPQVFTIETPQGGLDLGAPVEGEQRGAPPKAEIINPAENLVTDVSAAPLERFLSAFQPSSPSETEQEKQKNALVGKDGKGGVIQAIRDMYEDLKVDNPDLPYYTGLVKDFFSKFFKPVSPEMVSKFENIDKMSAEEQKEFLKRYTKLPDITTYDGLNKLRLAFNDFISEQLLKGQGITPGTNAYTQAKKSLAALKQKATDTPNKLDDAERAAHNYFRRFDFDTALRAAAFDIAYGTPRNELFSGQGADYASFFHEWLLTNAPESTIKKFDSYLRSYEHRATRDAQIDKIREEKNLTAEETAKTEAEYERGARRDKTAAADEVFEPETVPLATPQFQRGFDFRKIFGTSEEVSGSLNQMLHPAVEQAIRNNDINGTLGNLLATAKLTAYQKQLISRLLSLNLKTSIGFNQVDSLLSRYVVPIDSAASLAFKYVGEQIEGLSKGNDIFSKWGRHAQNIASNRSSDGKRDLTHLVKKDPYEKLTIMCLMMHDLVENTSVDEVPTNLREYAEELYLRLSNLRSNYDSHGVYFHELDAITINTERSKTGYQPQGNSVYVLLHEIMHAATVNALKAPQNSKQKHAADELEKLYKLSKNISGLNKYGFTDIYEFVAEAFTNHEFQKVLKDIKYRGNASKSLWDKFVDFCMRIFGYDNVLGQTLIYGNAIMSVPKGTKVFGSSPTHAAKGYYENNSNEQPGAIRSIGNQIRNSQKFDEIKFILSELWSTMKDQTRKYWLGAFTLRQLEEMIGIEYNHLTGKFETKVPQISYLIKNIEDMQDSRNKLIQKGKPILDKLQKLYSGNQPTSDALTRIVQTSTALQIDPTSPNPPSDATKKKMYDKLRADWEALGKMKDGTVAQELYNEMRDYFKSTLDNYKRISAEREYRRILSSTEAANRAAQEYVNKVMPAYRKMYTDKTDEELQGMIESELLQDASKLVNSGKETTETALARVLADKKIAGQFEKMIEPYFPLKRFGRFWYKEGTGQNMKFYMFESAFARDQALKKARAAKPNEAYVSGNDTRSMTATALQNARLFEEIKDIIGDVSAATTEDQKKQLLDQIGELFITTLPSQSIRNMFLHRKNVPGASADMVRSFAHAMFHLGYQQARFEYAPKLFDSMSAANAFLSTNGESTTAEEDAARRALKDYLGEIQKRVDNVLSPTDQGWITTFLSNLSFLNYLTSPASAIVNMLAVPTIGYPVLAGPYGWGNARQAYSKYMKMLSGSGWKDEFGNFDVPSIGRNPNLTDAEKRAYQAFIDAGLIDISMTHDIAGLSEQPSNEYTGRWNKVMTIAAFPFHKAERFNREVTAMAAFDLAYKSNGGNFEDAVEKAKNLTYKSMFDYSTANKPRYLQGDLPKVLLQFKQYAQHMTYLLFRTAYEASSQVGKEEYARLMSEGKTEEAQKVLEMSKQIRQDARRTFTGMMGMSFLFAGTMGMPVWFIFSGIANAFAAVFGDDEEEYDVENWYKSWLNSVFGGFVGDSIARGVVPQVTGASLSDRMSTNLTDMWWRDTKRNQDEVSAFQNTIINLLGPTVGMGVNAAEAVKRFNDGHVERAFEAIAPAGLKNIMVGSRLASEGALTMKGDTLLDDISAKEAFIQMLGFSPERLAQRQAANIEAKSMEEKLKSRRQDLLNFLAMAYDAGDSDGVGDLMDKIAEWNSVHPEKSLRITTDTIKNSMQKRAKERAQASALGGLRINKAFISRAEEMTGYAEDEDED